MKEDLEFAGKLGAIVGSILGFITGALFANFVIFPILTGYTLSELLKRLW
jgi:Sec-independent protein secretion pathway component TatC